VKKKSQSRKRIIKRPRIIQRAATPLPPAVSPPADVLPHPEGMPPIEAYPPWRSPTQAGAYLDISLPIVYRMLKTGELESYTFGGRRRVTRVSIRYHMLPPIERGPMPKPSAPYERLSAPPLRWLNSKPLCRRTAKAGGRAGAGR
jgi:excisionase family DNA binding protein